MPQDRQFSFPKVLLFSSILIIATFAVAEFGVRTWAYYFRGVYERYDPSTETFVLVPGEYSFGRSTLRINSAGFVGDELPVDLADSFRILAVGDSCTFGDSDYLTSYPALLEQRLREEGVAARVVNGGVEGMNAEMALRRFEAKAPLVRPNVAIIYIGWNDLMKSSPTAQIGVGFIGATAAALDRLWLAKGLRKLIFYYLRPSIDPPEITPETYDGTFREFEPTSYHANLIRLVHAARAKEATPILVTLPSVLAKNMTQDDLRVANVVFPYFQEASHLHDFIDLVDAYNRVIRAVAEQEGVELADLAEHFDGLADKRPLFYDTMHANAEGRRLIASILERRIRETMHPPSID